MQETNDQSSLLKLFISRPFWLACAAFIYISGCSGIPQAPIQKDAKVESESAISINRNFKVSAGIQKEYEMALEAMRAEQYGEAIVMFKSVAQKDSRLSGPWVNTAIAYRTIGNIEKADEAIKNAIKVNPDNPYAYNQAGIIKRMQGKFSESHEYYLKALAEHPDYANAHLNLAILCDLYLQRIVCAKEHYQAYQSLGGNEDKKVVAWLSNLERKNKQAK